MMRRNEAMKVKPAKSTRASTSRIDLDKTVNSIEELLSERYGGSPFETSIDYNRSDSDFRP